MHPQAFIQRNQPQEGKPRLSDADREERLAQIGRAIAEKRKEAVDARKSSGIESVWARCEDAYLGIDDTNRHEFADARWAKPTSIQGPLTSNKSPADNTRSTAFVRLTSRYVDNAAAKLAEILLPIDDKAFSFKPSPLPEMIGNIGNPPAQPQVVAPTMGASPQAQPAQAADSAKQTMDAANDAAAKAEKRIYDWMVESKWPAEVRKVIHDASRIGVGVLKGPFPKQRRSQAVSKMPDGVKMEIVIKVVPAVEWIDPWNIFPMEGCGENIHDGDGLFERSFLSKRRLSELKNDENYLPDEISKAIEEGPNKKYEEGNSQREQDKQKKYQFEVWHYYGMLSRDDLEVAIADPSLLDGMEDEEDLPVIVTMVNDRVIKAVLNPMDSGRFPYQVMTWSRRAGHWAGVGVAEQLNMPQRLVNASTRAMLNNAGISAGPQIVINRQAVEPADGSSSITPNKLWYMTEDGTDVRQAFMAVPIPNVEQQLMAIIEYGMKLAEESTNIPLVTQGQQGDTSPQTFGQAELQNSNAHTWLRSIGSSFDDMITEPVIHGFYEWLLTDPDVPDDEKGDFEINASGSAALVERAIQEYTYMAMLNVAANPANPFGWDPVRVGEEYARSKRIDPRRISYSDEEKAQRAQQQPQPPESVQVAQINADAKLKGITTQGQIDLQRDAQSLAHEQQLLQTGGASPHQASAMARIEAERIRANSVANTEALRANTELARAEKEREIAQQNDEYDLEKMRLAREQMLLEYSLKHNLTLEQVKAQLAQTAMQEQTKRQLAGAEIELAQSEGAHDRAIDLHKHTTSLVRDEINTPVTP